MAVRLREIALLNKRLSSERRKVVLIASSIAALSAGMVPLSQRHPQVIAVWLCFLGVAMIYVITQLVRIKRNRR
jgi:hypothetical protein